MPDLISCSYIYFPSPIEDLLKYPIYYIQSD